MRTTTSLNSGKMEGKTKLKKSLIINMENLLKIYPFNNEAET